MRDCARPGANDVAECPILGHRGVMLAKHTPPKVPAVTVLVLDPCPACFDPLAFEPPESCVRCHGRLAISRVVAVVPPREVVRA